MSNYCSDLNTLANQVKPPVVKQRTIVAVAATVGALSKATGTTWGYNEDTKSFYEMTPMKNTKTISPTYVERETDYGGEYINANIIDAWEALMASGIPNRKYSMGESPGIEGKRQDRTEYICQNFAIDATNYLNSIKDNDGNKKFSAVAINLVGTDTQGKTIPHVVIKIEDKTDAMAYWIDPSAGIWSEKEETKLESMQKWIKDPRSYAPFATTRIPITTKVTYAGTLVEPQTGQTGKTGYDLTGTKMMLGDTEYTIEHIEELPNVIQTTAYIYDEGILAATPTAIGKNRIAQTTENYAPALEKVRQALYDKNAPKKALELYDKDISFATMKQSQRIEKENAMIILEKRKQLAATTKSTEELKQLYPIEKLEETKTKYEQKITNEVKPQMKVSEEDLDKITAYMEEF
jgi:hypothetical protein